MIGRVISRYRIESKIGEGGMGVVYKAHDTSLDRHVAIKVLAQDRVADPARRQRFALEARAASALNHPGIVTVHDIVSDAGVDFMVMELVSGRTLDQVIDGRGMGVARALRYGAAIADAMAKAHEAGIVHRDLKPSNVMVTDDDRIKVLDFGLAKLLEPSGDHGQGKTRTGSLTEAGVMLGTAAYMSPEQVEGRAIDARSDIFSLGAVLYEMVTGRRPFTAESQVGVLSKIVHDDPPAPSQFASMAPELERAILRCLRKDPARRFQTAADLKVALDDLADDSASGALAAPAVVRAPRRRAWAWAALVPVLLGVGYGAWLWSIADDDTPLQAVPLASLPGVTRSPSFSPDGNQVAYSWNGPDGANVDVYVQQIGSGAPLRLTTNPANDTSPLWSPDGRWIAFLRQLDAGRQELRLVPPLGGPERRLSELRPRDVLRPLTLAWCPASDCVVATDGVGDVRADALFVVSLDAGTKRQLTSPPDGNMSDNDPAISPDGQWLAFRRESAPFAGEVVLQPLADNLTTAGEPRTVTPVTFAAYNPRWTPDSAALIFSARGGLWSLRVDDDGPPQRLPFVGEDGLMPVVSRPQPDRGARLVYVRSYTDANIWRVDVPSPGSAASLPPAAAISSTRRDAIPGVSPDGRHVAFTSTRSGDNEVWRAESSGSAAVQLTSMGINPGWPRWSPDGQHIAFHGLGVGGPGDIYVMPAEGGTARNLTSQPASDAFPSFSRDGRWIYFSSTRSGEPSIWKAPVSGGPAVQVTTGPGVMAVESRDGAHLYYTEGPAAVSAAVLWRIPVAGGAAPVRIADGVVGAAFDVVEGGVYYLERVPGEARLQFVDAASQTVTTVARNLGNVEFGLGASPDGRAIYFTRIDASVNDLMLVERFR